MEKLLKGGLVVSGQSVRQADVLLDGQKICAVGEHLSSDRGEIIDCRGKLLFPGFIDGHTHFDLAVAGTVTADDFATGSRAALRGGTTIEGMKVLEDRDLYGIVSEACDKCIKRAYELG